MPKNNSNTNSQPAQLSLFTPQFDSRIRRIEIDGVTYFSVLDVFTHYGKAKNSRTSWETAKNRLEKQGFNSSREILQLQFEGERQRETPIASFKTMLRIAQVTDFKEWEYVRGWMAEVAHERIEEELHPETIRANAQQREIEAWRRQGRSEEWIQQRIQGKGSRNILTATAKVTHVVGDPDYRALTARGYKETLGMSRTEIIRVLGLTDSQAVHFRDHLNGLALQAIDSAELTASMKMEQLGRLLTDQEQMEIVIHASRLFAPTFRQAAEFVGVNIATGKPLLKSRN